VPKVLGREEEVILTGPAIREYVKAGTIEIDPFVPEHVNPVSVDLTLGRKVVQYQRPITAVLDGPWSLVTGQRVYRKELDAKCEEPTSERSIDDAGIVLDPGQLYLMHTVERVYTDVFVPIVDGKSSIGRLGVSVHQTAGYGDPGFNGQYTLEVTCVVPVRLYAGMRIAQMRFHTVHGEIELYGGNYVEETARGPIASRSWRQFK
jgi:dCTP deaminase